jgi:hypothetical protein
VACKSRAKAGSKSTNICVGDIVVVKSDCTKRAFWKLARVEELLTSKDGKICAARVRVANNEKESDLHSKSHPALDSIGSQGVVRSEYRNRAGVLAG